MINAKVKILESSFIDFLQKEMNEFLQKIDVRQIIKTEFSSAGTTSFRYIAIIYYVELDDIRDAKIDNVLEIK